MSKYDEFKPQPENRIDTTVTAKVRRGEIEELDAIAKELGMTRSSTIRMFIVLGAREYRNE